MAKKTMVIYVCDKAGCTKETTNKDEFVPVKIGGERSAPKALVCKQCAHDLMVSLELLEIPTEENK
jgi:hypothetical protein